MTQIQAYSPANPMSGSQKKILLALGLVALGGGAYYLWSASRKKADEDGPAPEEAGDGSAESKESTDRRQTQGPPYPWTRSVEGFARLGAANFGKRIQPPTPSNENVVRLSAQVARALYPDSPKTKESSWPDNPTDALKLASGADSQLATLTGAKAYAEIYKISRETLTRLNQNSRT